MSTVVLTSMARFPRSRLATKSSVKFLGYLTEGILNFNKLDQCFPSSLLGKFCNHKCEMLNEMQFTFRILFWFINLPLPNIYMSYKLHIFILKSKIRKWNKAIMTPSETDTKSRLQKLHKPRVKDDRMERYFPVVPIFCNVGTTSRGISSLFRKIYVPLDFSPIISGLFDLIAFFLLYADTK